MTLETQGTGAHTTVTVVRHAHGGGTVLLSDGDGAGVRLTFDYGETARMEAFVALLGGLAYPHPQTTRQARPPRQKRRAA